MIKRARMSTPGHTRAIQPNPYENLGVFSSTNLNVERRPMFPETCSVGLLFVLTF